MYAKSSYGGFLFNSEESNSIYLCRAVCPAMTPNDHLFQLIKSLTASEKRYFKLFAAKQSEGRTTNYEKLFDAYNELPDGTYNEEEFAKSLKAKKLGKYLSDEKKYLTELVMKAMRVYSAEKKAEGRLAEMIQEINFLIEKGLLEQGEKIVEKAWAIAEEREQIDQKLKLLHIKREIDKQDYNNGREAYQKDLRKQEELALAQLNDEREAAFLREQLYGIYITHQMQARSAEVEQIFDKLDKLQQRPYQTFNCLNNIVSAKCIVLDNKKGYRQGMDLLKYMLGIWEKNPARIEEMPDRYVKLVSHYMVFVFRAEDYGQIPFFIDKLNRVKTLEKDVLKDIFFLSVTSRLFGYINTSKFKEALQMVDEIKEGLEKYDALLSFVQKRVLGSNVSLIYLKNKKYAEVLDAVEEVYALVGRHKEKQHRLEDMKVFEFIAHYELGNSELLQYTVRNNQRYFKDHQPDNAFIETLWKLFKQFIQNPEKPKKAKQQLKEQVQGLDCPAVNVALKDEVVAWLGV